jgi:mannose-6-phosphate isomerase-like protein (cupin superfamily)
MMLWETKAIGRQPDLHAPDGSEVYLGLECSRGGLAVFVLPAGTVSRAVRHATIEEVWFFIDGEGELWRRSGESEETCPVGPGVFLTIPTGTAFQFRAFEGAPLRFAIATMPPWPGSCEALPADGPWVATEEVATEE